MEPVSPLSHRSLAAAALVLCVALGVWARCADFRSVFGGSEVELLPSDSHYYIRFARLQLAAFPHFVDRDPLVNFPERARIIWPRGHALSVAAAIRVSGVERAERAAAFVGPAWSLLWLLAIAALGWRRLEPHGAVALVAVLALTPAAVASGALGNADHHVHEPFLAAMLLLWLEPNGSRARPVAFGVALAAGRLLSPLAFLFLPLSAGALLAAACLRGDREAVARFSVRAGLASALTLAALVVLTGDPRSFAYVELSWFHPLLAVAAFAAPVAVARTGRHRLAALIVGVVALLGCAPELRVALGHLGRADPLLALVLESQPLAADLPWAYELLGPLLLLAPLAIGLAMAGAVRTRRFEGLAAALFAGGLLACALLQARFSQAFVGAAGVVVAEQLARRRFSRAWLGPAIVAAALLPFVVQLVPQPPSTPHPAVAQVRESLGWLRAHSEPACDPFDPTAQPRYGVVGSYLLGHLITLWAERPAIATPFSQAPWHQAGNERAYRVLGAPDEEHAWRAAEEIRARYVIATPLEAVLGRPDLDPTQVFAAQLRTVDAGALRHFRLVHESEGHWRDGRPYLRIFEVLPERAGR